MDESVEKQVAVPNSDDKLWVIACHASALIGAGFWLPLIVFLVKRGENEFVAENAREALNFHLSLLIYAIVCIPLIFVIIGFFLLIGISIAGFVLAIIACLKSSEGRMYRYPLTIRMV